MKFLTKLFWLSVLIAVILILYAFYGHPLKVESELIPPQVLVG